MNKKILLLLLGVLINLSSVFSTTITSCPYIISSSGSYNLTDNLTTNDGSCISISDVEDVSFDCNNFTIRDINETAGFSGISIGASTSNTNNIYISNCIFDNYYRSIRISTSSFTYNLSNIFFENITVRNSTYTAIHIDNNPELGIYNISFNNLFADNSNFKGVEFDLIGDIMNIFFTNSILSPEESFFSNFGNNRIKNLTIINTTMGGITNGVFFDNSLIKNTYLQNLTYLMGENNTLTNITSSSQGIGFYGNNTFLENSLIELLYVDSVNNTFINNTFTNLSDISVTASPNNFTSNTYYNSSGSGSGLTICFFTGVCDTNSEVILFESLESLSSASSLFPFGSVLVSFIFVVGFFFFS